MVATAASRLRRSRKSRDQKRATLRPRPSLSAPSARQVTEYCHVYERRPASRNIAVSDENAGSLQTILKEIKAEGTKDLLGEESNPEGLTYEIRNRSLQKHGQFDRNSLLRINPWQAKRITNHACISVRKRSKRQRKRNLPRIDASPRGRSRCQNRT